MRRIAEGNWTYGNDPENSALDRVRGDCGDFDDTRKFLTDAEVEYQIATQETELLAAYHCAKKIAALCAGYHDRSAGGVTENYGDLSKQFDSLATDLMKRSPHAIPQAPSLRYTDRQELQDDTDLVPPPFHKGMHSVDGIGRTPDTLPRNVDEEEEA